MTVDAISPSPCPPDRTRNLSDYEAERAHFSWEAASSQLDGLGGDALNIAHEAVDRHATGPRAHSVALRFIRQDLSASEITYAELRRDTSRFAEVLASLGVQRGERVVSLAGRVSELYTAALGTMKAGAVFCPLFSAFGPEPIQQRLERGNAAVLVTTAALYRRKVAAQRDRLPELRYVLLIEGEDDDDAGVYDLRRLMAAMPGHAAAVATDPEEPALLHFTSGSTGRPKGALHVHSSAVAHFATGGYALDLRADDVFWCTADPGWVTGTSYGIIAPLTHGTTVIVDEAAFDARRWYRILEEQRVTVWYTAPTAIRMLMRAGDDLVGEHDLSSLAMVASVGEPLNPEAVVWGAEVLGHTIHDNWWQTETGGIMVANFPACEVRPGSMGRPLPGIEVAIIAVDEDNQPISDETGARFVEEPDTEGMLAIAMGWPSMFRTYLHDQERYDRSFLDGWYLSGDLATRDEDGYLWFVARADDVIKTAGHLIGPFEVESVLMEHSAVVEAGVIGVPDELAGNIVKAFVTLASGTEWNEELRLELIGHARRRLGAAVAPRDIAWEPHLPKTRSGKIMRRLLRARELGEPEGDLSTLEPDPDAEQTDDP